MKKLLLTLVAFCAALAAAAQTPDTTAAIRSSLALRYAVSASPYWKYICPAFFLYNFSFAHQLLI